MPTQRTGRREIFRRTLVARSRDMRGHLTAAELKLWQEIRGDKLGVRFRRQHRIGFYIADFYCSAAKLVIEVDGDAHEEREEYDARRTHWMKRMRGLRVVRFTNDDVLKYPQAVVQSIADLCAGAARPSPPPSPRVRGEGGNH